MSDFLKVIDRTYGVTPDNVRYSVVSGCDVQGGGSGTGGGTATAACHLARTVVRRAERHAWTLARREPVPDEITKYLNRLSDLLFVVSRLLARHEGGSEVLWRHDR